MIRPLRYISILSAVALLLALIGCGQQAGGDSGAPGSQGIPELTKQVIDERINDTRVYDVLPESGTGEPIPWSFDHDEPKEIAVVDQKIDGASATIVLDITTRSSPRSKVQRQLTGQIRTDWQLETGWVLRRWEIVNTENISMKYKDLPKASSQNNNN